MRLDSLKQQNSIKFSTDFTQPRKIFTNSLQKHCLHACMFFYLFSTTDAFIKQFSFKIYFKHLKKNHNEHRKKKSINNKLSWWALGQKDSSCVDNFSVYLVGWLIRISLSGVNTWQLLEHFWSTKHSTNLKKLWVKGYYSVSSQTCLLLWSVSTLYQISVHSWKVKKSTCFWPPQLDLSKLVFWFKKKKKNI